MDIYQLRALRQIVETGSVTRAAEELALTQPAVSHQIHALERELGQPLLRREGRGVAVTHAGQVLYDYARRILNLVDESLAALEDLRTGERGVVTVAAIGTTTTYVLPDLLHEFRLQHPGVQITLRTAGGEEVKEMVEHKAADLGIVGSHTATTGFHTVPLFSDRIVPVVNPTHPYAALGKTSLVRLAEEPLILLGGWKSWENYVLSMFAQAGARPRVHLQLDSIEAVKRMVERGLGFALLPESTVGIEVSAGTLVPLTLEDVPLLRRDILLIHRRDTHLSAAMGAFIKLLTTRLGRREVVTPADP